MDNQVAIVEFTRKLASRERAQAKILELLASPEPPKRDPANKLHCPECNAHLDMLFLRVNGEDEAGRVPYCDPCCQVYDFGFKNENEMYDVDDANDIVIISL